MGKKCVWILVFTSFEYIPSSGIAGSCGSSWFNVLRSHHTLFHSGCTIWLSPQDSNSSVASPTLAVFCVVCYRSHPDGVTLWSGISPWFCFAFPWWSERLSVFSREMSVQVFSDFRTGFSFCCYQVGGVTYSGHESLVDQIYDLKIFSPTA